MCPAGLDHVPRPLYPEYIPVVHHHLAQLGDGDDAGELRVEDAERLEYLLLGVSISPELAHQLHERVQLHQTVYTQRDVQLPSFTRTTLC